MVLQPTGLSHQLQSVCHVGAELMQLPANGLGKQQTIATVLGSLLPKWETQKDLLVWARSCAGRCGYLESELADGKS